MLQEWALVKRSVCVPALRSLERIIAPAQRAITVKQTVQKLAVTIARLPVQAVVRAQDTANVKVAEEPM